MAKVTVPRMMTIKQVAETGVLSEYALRMLYHEGKLPCVTLKRKILVNFDELLNRLAEGI